MTNKSKLSLCDRRTALRWGVQGALGSGLLLGRSPWNHHPSIAMAQTAPAHPVIQICLIDKVQQALIFPVSDAVGAGDLNGLDGQGVTVAGNDISGQALPANAVNFRGINLTALFGQKLIFRHDFGPMLL